MSGNRENRSISTSNASTNFGIRIFRRGFPTLGDEIFSFTIDRDGNATYVLNKKAILTDDSGKDIINV